MKKQTLAAACALMITLCLSGCGMTMHSRPMEKTEPIEAEGSSDTLAVESVIPEIPSAAVPEEADTQHFTLEITGNIRVDAEVVMPKKEAYSIYTLKRVDSNPDRLFGIFSPEGYGSYTTDERSSLRYLESSGKKLVVREDSIGYSAYNIDWGENPMQEVNTLMYYYTQNHSQAEPHDLSFMTVAEMEHFCRDILSKLGIAFEPELLKCVTLTGQEIMDFQQELFGSGGSYTQMGFTPTNLTTATDTCYLEFSFAYDGLPLLGSEEPGVASAVSMMPTPSVTATMMINADGLQKCDVYFPCTIEAVSQPQAVLPLDEAAAVLKEKYHSEIRSETTEFSNIWLEYIPISNGDSVTMTPYWCFAQIDRELEKTAPGYRGNADRINAITGKDLAYGG